MHSVVFRGQDVPAWLRSPRDLVRAELLLLEQIIDGRIMGRPNQLLVCLGEIACEELGATRKHPGTPIRHLDARENVRGIFVELILYGFAGIRSDRCNVHQPDHALTRACACNGGPAVRMTDQEDRTTDTIE